MNVTIKAIAVDDEPIALEIIEALASKVSFLDLPASFVNAFDAIKYLKENPVDLIFLDIKMPDISGFEMLKALDKKPLVIFTTAYTEHAFKSYELDAVDYLLKPFSLERFSKACDKAAEILEFRNKTLMQKPDFLFLKSGFGQVKIFFDDILFIESSGNYMVFMLQNSKTLSRLTMKEVLQFLPETDFIRVHRSFIVSKNRVSKIERNQLHIGKNIVPVGSMFSDQVETCFSDISS
ncbi:LytR/AlgR family response regulator transcription factor [Dyadobacter frigoris]|uniref:Response regulator transcription factor n=1 Tax=Dyadobacter frigoris TaxID=2576211 RepID=A0A4U6D6I4_9BACT|nr:LytTR family DNA-binding domain-containing protein [Dyadobacter frigoris]TKT92316.1 response regulator transcription factor [Dyadobacter frigoris]GLU53502.1 DNA-binding response regulator [Dyadobacter frigoris]